MPKLEPAAIYLALFARESRHEVNRWALFVPTTHSGHGRLFRIVERSTSRITAPIIHFEAKEYDILNDTRLFLVVKLGGLGNLSLDDLGRILRAVGIPQPDDEYSHFFDGRTWTIKAIMRLSAYGVIKSRRLETMEHQIHELAAQAFHSYSIHGGWTLGEV